MMKKLIVVFDLDEFNYLKADIKENSILFYIGYLKALCFEKGKLEYDIEVSNAEKAVWLERFKLQVSNGSIESIRIYANLIFANFIRPLEYGLFCLEKLITSNKIDSVHLCSVIHKGYFPLVAAEGDNVKQLLWYKDIFYSSLIFDSLKDTGIQTTFSGKSVFWKRLLLRMRPAIVGLLKAAIQVKQNGLTWSNRTSNVDLSEDVVLVRNDIAVRTVNYLKKIGMLDNQAVSIIFRQLNKKSTKSSVELTPSISLKVSVKALFSVVKDCFVRRKVCTSEYFSLGSGSVTTKVSSDAIARAIEFELIDKEIYFKTLRELFDISEGIRRVHSFEMINPTANLDISAARKSKLTISSYQVASIDYNRIVDFPDFDFFSCSSKFDKEMLINLGVSGNKLKLLNGDGFESESIEKEKSEIKKVVYFSQPFPMPLDENIAILTLLLKLSKMHNFELLVRPHPRDNLEYHKLFPDIGILTDNNGLGRLYDADLVVSRTSRILFDSLFQNIPYCALLLNNHSRDVKSIYTCEEMSSSIYYHLNEFESMFDNVRQFLAKFYESRTITLKKYT